MPLVEKVHAADAAEQQRWAGRVERARNGTAVGEDAGEGGEPRLAREHAEERAIEEGQVKEEDTGRWTIDLSAFGLPSVPRGEGGVQP